MTLVENAERKHRPRDSHHCPEEFLGHLYETKIQQIMLQQFTQGRYMATQELIHMQQQWTQNTPLPDPRRDAQ